jgi:hypothetical protein
MGRKDHGVVVDYVEENLNLANCYKVVGFSFTLSRVLIYGGYRFKGFSRYKGFFFGFRTKGFFERKIPNVTNLKLERGKN